MRFRVFLLIFLVLFVSANYYIGLRGLQWLQVLVPAVSGWIYWLTFLLVSFSYLIARGWRAILPWPVVRVLSLVGAYWMSTMLYLLPLLLLVDLGRLIAGWLGLIPQGVAEEMIRLTGGVVLLLLWAVLIYGVWSARNPVVVRYDVDIPKPGGKHKELHVALVSDTHLGPIRGLRTVRQMVKMVNDLEPDLILHAGDLIDDTLHGFVALDLASELKQMRSKLGTYVVLGNHDWADLTELRAETLRAGMHLLVDEWVKVDDSFYVVGRKDVSYRTRAPLKAILQGVDSSLPILLMDHQPNRLAEAEEAGVDLVVSGHTHRGQLAPFHYITRRVFEVDWGYLKKGATHVIVSLGFGTWGPPVRVGNRPEVVSIRVRFTG